MWFWPKCCDVTATGKVTMDLAEKLLTTGLKASVACGLELALDPYAHIQYGTTSIYLPITLPVFRQFSAS